MWVSEVDGGSLCDTVRLVGAFLGTGVRDWVDVRVGGRMEVEEVVTDVVRALALPGFGVRLSAVDGILDLFCDDGIGVLSFEVGLASDAEASDMGGDGGSARESGSLPGGGRATSLGGVVMRGELAVERGEFSKVGDSRRDRSVDMVDRWRLRLSAFLTLSCRMSASTLRSDSSSRRRWASMRSVSRSWSPIFISSSIMTLRSMAWLYLDSMSSSEEVVLRACRSKSSLATSMSRSLSCRVLLVSRRVVISFSRLFWAAFASDLAFLHFSCGVRARSVCQGHYYQGAIGGALTFHSSTSNL